MVTSGWVVKEDLSWASGIGLCVGLCDQCDLEAVVRDELSW